jgi:Cytochrome P460
MKREFQRLVFVIVSVCLLMALGLLVGHFRLSPFTSTAMRIAPVDGEVKEIAGYRGWSKVNTEPQLMPDRTSFLCAAPLATAKDPHLNKYATVYVNDIGRKAMLEQLKPFFPEGSVIVKEKLPDKSSQEPELMTVMIKRGKGFNPTSGDWEYMVVDGAGTKVVAQGKLENCQSCHTAKPGTDYVFRTYLPNEVLGKLK